MGRPPPTTLNRCDHLNLSLRQAFAGSEEGGRGAAAIYTLIGTCKLNDVDPPAWPADVLRRINNHPVVKLTELLRWNWKDPRAKLAA